MTTGVGNPAPRVAIGTATPTHNPGANVAQSAMIANAHRATNRNGVVEMDSEALVDLIITDLSKRSMIGRAIEQVDEERGKGWLRSEVKKMVKEVTK